MGRLRVTEATVKQLFGSASRCAYPDCDAPLIRFLDGSDLPILNSQIAHIRAASEDGPRFDPEMTDDARRQFGNLLLLCHSHHAEVDLPDFAARYPAETLEAWRRKQMSGPAGHDISDALATRAAEVDHLWSLWDFSGARIRLGGEGGQAPGAGGGGGGAIGPGARGGAGGPGGDRSIAFVDAAGLDDKTEVWIGPGGRPGVFGMPGECGSHTVFGRLLTPAGGRQIHTVADDNAESDFVVDVSSAIFADGVAVHDGLAYMHRSGWGSYAVSTIPAPFRAGLAVVLSVAWAGSTSEDGHSVEVIAELLTPSGTATFSEKRSVTFTPPTEAPGSSTLVLALGVQGTLHETGVHILHVSCNNEGHLDQPLMVVAPADV